MTVTTIRTPSDSLTPAAARAIRGLFAELDAAKAEEEAVAAERRTQPRRFSLAELAERDRDAQVRRDRAIFALHLGLGKHANEAVLETTAFKVAVERYRQLVNAPQPEPQEAQILQFPKRSVEDDPWMNSKESAEYAGCLSDNGVVSSRWRETLRQLVARELAHHIGEHPNSPIRVRRSVVDDVIEGRIDLEGGA